MWGSREHARPPQWPAISGGEDVTITVARVRERRPRLRRIWRVAWRVTVVGLALAVAVVALAGWRLEATVTSYAGAHFNQGHNAIWLEHTWAGDPHTSGEYDALAALLAREQIGYVFVHVGPLNSDGTIPLARAPYAATLATALHMRLPGLRVLAWIGQLEAASGLPADEVVNLANSPVRAAIVATALRFVGYGMNGVHYDIEPIVNNDPHFLDLLDETRQALPAGAILSISAQKWAPNAHLATWIYQTGHADAWWTSYYYGDVAAHVDQLVVMAYNTAMPTAALYELAVKLETQNILAAARTAPHPPQVLIGLPTYTGDTTWFHSRAENMTSGLTGVTAGLNSDRATAPFGGVAIYRLGTTTAADWTTYNRLWLGD